jgi:prophage maintenance system killer protein
MAAMSRQRRYVRSRVAPFLVPQDADDAYQSVVDQLFEDIVGFNAIILDLPPGVTALTHENLLRSAIGRSFTMVGMQYIYSDGLLQASALLYSLVQNHAFSDGNKRTAYWSCAYFLQRCGYWRYDIFLNRREAVAYETWCWISPAKARMCSVGG